MPLNDLLSLQSLIWWGCVVVIAGGALVILGALVMALFRKISVDRAIIIIIGGFLITGVGAYILPLAHAMFRSH